MNLNQRARKLRRDQTDAERRRWRALRNRRIEGCKFRRQYPIGGYIADIACPERRLILELDGGQHSEQMDYDLRRTRLLEARGFRVLRVWDNDVLNNTHAVLAAIQMALMEHPSPIPLPSQGRGRKKA